MVIGGRPTGPPLILADLQRSPMMRRRYRPPPEDEVDGAAENKQEEKSASVSSDQKSASVLSDLKEPNNQRGESPSVGSVATHTPSLSSFDMLQTEESDVGSKSSAGEEQPTRRQPSRSGFRAQTAYDWDSKDVVHWLQHKLKREDLGTMFEEHSVSGEMLLMLDLGKMKFLGVTNSKDQALLKKEIKSLKSQAEKSRKEEKKRLEREAKLELKRQKEAEKEAKRQEKTKK